MKISLLKSGQAPLGSVGTRTLYHLSLDRTFAQICREETKRHAFFRVLSAPLLSVEEITQRQEVIRDFIQHEGFFGALCSLLARFDELRKKHQSEHRETVCILSDPAAAHTDTVRNRIQANALTLKRTLLFLKAIAELLEKHPISAKLLLSLHDHIRRHTDSEGCEDLLHLCATFEQFGTARVDVRFTLDGDGRVRELQPVEPLPLALEPTRPKGFFRRKKEAEATEIYLQFPRGDEIGELLKIAPLRDLSQLFDALTSQLLQKFGGICEELAFYEVVLQYHKVLREKGVSLCFPKMTEENIFSCEDLYDLSLLCTKKTADEVVPHSIPSLHGSQGIAVFGANGSGKTVFLRSVGTAQILAQAGLPISAKSAEVGICTSVLTQFSEAEKELEAGNDAGRFEQEVRELAAMLEELSNGALVLLNETFQTTAYAEGAEGLLPILQWFGTRGVRYVLVSHLSELECRLPKEGTTILHTGKSFRLLTNSNYT